MIETFHIRDAYPSDARFLAECILAGMHFWDFEGGLDDEMSLIINGITECEKRTDTLYTHTRTRVAEVDGTPVAALLSYPGELYKDLRDRTFRVYWPSFFTEHANDDLETDPGEYYLDSLAVLPAFRGHGIGKAMIDDGIQRGIAQGFTRIALVADAEMPHLVSLYKSIGFTPAEHRHAFGTDYLRMIYLKKD